MKYLSIKINNSALQKFSDMLLDAVFLFLRDLITKFVDTICLVTRGVRFYEL